MELVKQDVIDKILSFSFMELKEWIKKRLHGEDDYFPLYLNREPNFSEFIADSFYHIEDGRFRNDFIEILGKLTIEQAKLTKKEDIENSKGYIIELLKLCGRIRQFEDKDRLMEIAVSGRFKGIKIDEETDLHADLLTTLASYKITGNHEFWIKQLRDNSNRYYANPAFYALLDNLDRLFDNLDVFIDKFKEEIELEWGIEALCDEYGKNVITGRFKAIETKLSREQKEAVNTAFGELGYGKPYKIAPKPAKQTMYKPLKTAVSMAGEKPGEYGEDGAGETLREKAGEIFKRLGFQVHFDYNMAGHAVDIFIKRKMLFSDDFECYVCRCSEEKRKVGKHEVDGFLPVRDAAQGCDAVFISQTGFTKGAVQSALAHGILLKTLDDLTNE